MIFKLMKYFAYGSNMNLNRIKGRISSAVPLGRAKLANKRIIFNKKSIDGSGKANLADSDGYEVWGVLYEINTDELSILDKFEDGYTRICVDITDDQNLSLKAYTYISNNLTEDPRPYHSYKDLVIKGAIENKLPEQYVNLLRIAKSK